MPTYGFTCDECGHSWDEILKIDDRLNPLDENCPHCESRGHIRLQMAAPAMADPVRLGRIRPDNGFKEVLQKISERTPGSQLEKNSSLTRL